MSEEEERKGVSPAIILVPFIFVGVFVLFIIAANYGDLVLGEGQQAIGDNFMKNILGEQVLDMPCATSTRGVFYNSSVISGDFSCLDPIGVTFLSFQYKQGSDYDGPQYTWAVYYDSDRGTVLTGAPGYDATFGQQYHVLINNSATGELTPARLRIGVRP
ncbi:MAG: hypothetical protein SV186_01270 [Candidatus Nanohaloarchaea archaeon]|nr:hypothetical protein [Candidatus Nanohaloarchaea archaeon]